MRRLGTGMRPEMRAIWEPAVETAREMLTPDELQSCVEFLSRALEMVSEASVAAEEQPVERPRPVAAVSKPAKRS